MASIFGRLPREWYSNSFQLLKDEKGQMGLAAAATVIVGILTLYLIVKVVEDLLIYGSETFYPNSRQTAAVSYKLIKASLGKGKAWKRNVQREGFRLDDRVLSLSLPLQPRSEHITDIVKTCELHGDAEHVPLMYPAVLMVYPNCLLFIKPNYPFPAIGSIHVANTTKIFRPLSAKETYPAMIKIQPAARAAKKGTEVTFLSILLDKNSHPIWRNESTFLVLHKRKAPITPTPRPGSEQPEESQAITSKQLDLPQNMGRRYAAVSKDNNPIHTSSLAAKLFGFPGIIMHGMYFLVRAASECQAHLGSDLTYPVEISAKFIRPIVLPHTVEFNVHEKDPMKKAKRSLKFQLLNKVGKVAIEGYFHSGVTT